MLSESMNDGVESGMARLEESGDDVWDRALTSSSACRDKVLILVTRNDRRRKLKCSVHSDCRCQLPEFNTGDSNISMA